MRAKDEVARLQATSPIAKRGRMKEAIQRAASYLHDATRWDQCDEADEDGTLLIDRLLDELIGIASSPEIPDNSFPAPETVVESEVVYDPSVLTEYGVTHETLMKLRSAGLETLQSIVDWHLHSEVGYHTLPFISAQEGCDIHIAVREHLAEQGAT